MTDRLRGLYAITPENSDGTRLLADVEAAVDRLWEQLVAP